MLNELFANLVKTGESTNRDYWVMTELFVCLHNGKDYCDGKLKKEPKWMEKIGNIKNGNKT